MGSLIGSQSGLSSSLPGLAQQQTAMQQMNSGASTLPVGGSIPTQLSSQATAGFAPFGTFESQGGPGLQTLNKTNQDVWASSLNRPLGTMADNVEQAVHQQNLADEDKKQWIGLLQGGLGALQQGFSGNQPSPAAVPNLRQSGLGSLSQQLPTTITPGLMRLLQNSQVSVPTNVPYLLNLNR